MTKDRGFFLSGKSFVRIFGCPESLLERGLNAFEADVGRGGFIV